MCPLDVFISPTGRATSARECGKYVETFPRSPARAQKEGPLKCPSDFENVGWRKARHSLFILPLPSFHLGRTRKGRKNGRGRTEGAVGMDGDENVVGNVEGEEEWEGEYAALQKKERKSCHRILLVALFVIRSA